MDKKSLKRQALYILAVGVLVALIGKFAPLPLTLKLFVGTFCIGAALVMLFLSNISGMFLMDEGDEDK